MSVLKTAAVVAIISVILDSIWLGVMTKKFYLFELRNIGRIEKGNLQIVYWAAAVVYVLLTFGITHFVLNRAEPDTSLLEIFVGGALFGLCCYGVYDMTNYATLKDFSLKLVFADMLWGTFMCGAVAALSRLTLRMI